LTIKTALVIIANIPRVPMYLDTLGIHTVTGAAFIKFIQKRRKTVMKWLAIAITSVGIWVFINAILGPGAMWNGILFGAITTICAFIAIFSVSKA
jgi:hypothetical protein